jgi:hypothetical protein
VEPSRSAAEGGFAGVGHIGVDRNPNAAKSSWAARKRRPDFAAESGEGRNRTGDTTVFSRVLYQLSYLARAGEV